MNQVDMVTALAEKAWAHRKQFGYLKSLPKEIQIEVVAMARSGKSAMVIARSLGVTKKTVRDSGEKFTAPEMIAEFREVPVVSELSSLANLEVRVVAQIKGARREIFCSDFDLVQALLKKLGA